MAFAHLVWYSSSAAVICTPHTAVVRSYIEDTMEAYWEVVEAPYGEGLVGMKFPHGWRTSCGSGGRWCKKLAKRVVPHWLVDAKEK